MDFWPTRGRFVSVSEVSCQRVKFLFNFFTAASRVLVEEKIAKQFCDAIVQIFEAASKGMGADTMDPKAQHGPVVDKEQFEKIMTYIEQGKKSATLLTGGGRIGTKGYVSSRSGL